MPALTSSKAFLEKRLEIIGQARKMYDEHQDENGNLPAEYRGQWEEMMAAAEAAKEAARDRQKMEVFSEVADKFDDSPVESSGKVPAFEDPAAMQIEVRDGHDRRGNPKYQKIAVHRGNAAYREAYDAYLRRGEKMLTLEQRANLRMDDAEQAGYLSAPEQMASGILKAVDDLVQVRQWARIRTVRNAASLGIRKRTSKMSTFNWSAELQVSTADSSLKYGKKVLHPRHLSGQIKISRDLIRNSVIPVEGEVTAEMARDAGEVMETAYMTGDGANKPLGVFTASSDGISTARDTLTGSTTDFTADGLIEAKYALKPAYRNGGTRAGARWLFHRLGMRRIAQLKDANDQYLLRTNLGLREDDPDMMLGMPVHESEFVPSTFTTGLYVGLLGNWMYYEIADSLDLEIQVLEELFAQTNEIGYIGRIKTDALPTLEEAFVRLKTS